MFYGTEKGAKSHPDLLHPSFYSLQCISNLLKTLEGHIFVPAFQFDSIYSPCCKPSLCINEELIRNLRTDTFMADIHDFYMSKVTLLPSFAVPSLVAHLGNNCRVWAGSCQWLCTPSLLSISLLQTHDVMKRRKSPKRYCCLRHTRDLLSPALSLAVPGTHFHALPAMNLSSPQCPPGHSFAGDARACHLNPSTDSEGRLWKSYRKATLPIEQPKGSSAAGGHSSEPDTKEEKKIDQAFQLNNYRQNPCQFRDTDFGELEHIWKVHESGFGSLTINCEFKSFIFLN